MILWLPLEVLCNCVEWTFSGVIVGLAIHNGHILSLSLARALYKKLLGAPVSLEDLQEMHAGVYNSLRHLLSYDGDRVEDDMCLTFQVWIHACLRRC